jgi:hypothetical protein
MHELWVAFADDPTAQHLAVDGDLRGRTPRQTFDDARLADALNGREITWMLLIDPEGGRGQLVASYEVPLSILPGARSRSFAADTTTVRHPSIKPTKTRGHPSPAAPS